VTSEWRDADGERARRYYSITDAGRRNLADFRDGWAKFSATVGGVLNHEHSGPATGAWQAARTEVIPLDQGWYVSGPSRGHCT
jgi:DNA-binding PadR family transcriptional regulator